MIQHILHHFDDGFNYTWTIQLPFRLNKGDQIHNELLINRGKLEYDKELTEEWMDFTFENEHLEVETIDIDHNANVVAWLMKSSL